VDRDLQSLVLDELNILLAPFAPHLAEELYETRGGKPSLFSHAKWVKYDPSAIKEESVTLVVQVNGKVRAKLTVPVNSGEDAIKSTALADENIKRHLEGKQIVKAIVVPNKIVNFVIK
jgi:leucyl-tRNA synthetase